MHPNILTGTPLQGIMESMPFSIYCKDKQGLYLEVNNVFVRTAEIAENNIIGKTDRELAWAELAPALMDNDQQVICTGHSKTQVEHVVVANKTHLFLSYKTPLYSSSNKIIGVFGISILLEEEKSIHQWLMNIGMNLNPYPSLAQQVEYFSFSNQMTKRQTDCLHYLVRGMTTKQIAHHLMLSPKTVEHHIEAIKNKLNCYSRSELIEKILTH